VVIQFEITTRCNFTCSIPGYYSGRDGCSQKRRLTAVATVRVMGAQIMLEADRHRIAI
jgi:hypothetical protein